MSNEYKKGIKYENLDIKYQVLCFYPKFKLCSPKLIFPPKKQKTIDPLCARTYLSLRAHISNIN